MRKYQPPLTLTPRMLALAAEIGERVGHLSALHEGTLTPQLRRGNRIRTIQASLAIENNTLSVEQVTLMDDLLAWLSRCELHPLIASCVFHYEFEFIHPFADGNGRMGRLWQTLILSQWRAVLAYLPVESVIREQQDAYYEALAVSDKAAEAAPFVEFMLAALRQALLEGVSGDQVSDQVSDQVARLLQALPPGEALKASELMQRLGLAHRPTFSNNYLKPALVAGLIEMTDPASPRSPAQKYRRTGFSK